MATLGRTSVPGTPSWYTFGTDDAVVAKYTWPNVVGDITNLRVYVKNIAIGSRNAKAVIYGWDAANARPGTRLAVSGVVAVAAGDDNVWKTFTVSLTDIQPGTILCFGIVVETASGIQAAYDGSTVPYFQKVISYATPADPFGSGAASGNADYCIYVTHTAVETSPPEAAFTAPGHDYDVVSGASVALAANAIDPEVGVASVQFKDPAGSNIGSADTAAPYTATWNSTTVEDGVQTLSAVVTDAADTPNTVTVYRKVIVANRVDGASPAGSVRWP